MSDQKSCNTCSNRCMDMDMDMEPYCCADGLLKKHPFGLTLSRNRISECKDHDYAWWVEDTLPALAGMYAIPGGHAPHPA